MPFADCVVVLTTPKSQAGGGQGILRKHGRILDHPAHAGNAAQRTRSRIVQEEGYRSEQRSGIADDRSLAVLTHLRDMTVDKPDWKSSYQGPCNSEEDHLAHEWEISECVWSHSSLAELMRWVLWAI